MSAISARRGVLCGALMTALWTTAAAQQRPAGAVVRADAQ